MPIDLEELRRGLAERWLPEGDDAMLFARGALHLAARAYLDAVASDGEVEAAIQGYRTGRAGDSHKVAMRAALTAAKINASAEYERGFNEAVEACADTSNRIAGKHSAGRHLQERCLMDGAMQCLRAIRTLKKGATP